MHRKRRAGNSRPGTSHLMTHLQRRARDYSVVCVCHSLMLLSDIINNFLSEFHYKYISLLYIYYGRFCNTVIELDLRIASVVTELVPCNYSSQTGNSIF